MFRKKQKITYKTMADFVAPKKKSSFRKKAAVIGLFSAAGAAISYAFITKESDSQ